MEADRDRGVELRVKTEDGAEVQHRRIAVDRPAEPVKKNPAHRHSPHLATELLRASGRQDPMAASDMKDADQDPRDDSYIRQVEHGPESNIDEIDDPAEPQAVQKVAASSAKSRAQGNGRNRTLEQRPELDDDNEENKLGTPERRQCRVAVKEICIESAIQHPSDRHPSEGRRLPLGQSGDDQSLRGLVEENQQEGRRKKRGRLHLAPYGRG